MIHSKSNIFSEIKAFNYHTVVPSFNEAKREAVENILEIGLNPLSDMPILGFLDSAANKDMSKYGQMGTHLSD